MFFKKRKILENNNKILMKRNSELGEVNTTLQKRVKELEQINKDLENELVITSELFDSKKKECKYLKQLLTKHGIEYRKGN